MNRLMMLVVLGALVGGCDDDTGAMNKTMDLAVSMIPTPPTLGMEIDRMGRPAINTALNNTFNPNDGTNGTTDLKGMAKDAYNAEGNQANWPTLMLNGKTVVQEFASNIAIIDALDGICGNTLPVATQASGDAGEANYAAVAGVLADDELYVDTSVGDCTLHMLGGNPIPNYLAVEARFLGLPFTACGGRTPLDDVIDESYSLLAAGISGTVVSDGVNADADPSTPASLDTFPFLNAPN